jgi:DNA mismatch repair protein MutS
MSIQGSFPAGDVGVERSELRSRSGGEPAPFRSILFGASKIVPPLDQRHAPDFFTDLHLDQVVDSITAGRDEYGLKPFFYAPLTDVRTINYRYDVLQDLEHPQLMDRIRSFAQEMRAMRAHLARSDKAYYPYEKERWFLEAVHTYCAAVSRLARDLALAELGSHGFQAFRDYLASYTESEEFVSLDADTAKLRSDLSSITYSLLIEGKRITVGRYEPAPDYGADVLQTFEKFKQGDVKDYRFEFRSWPDMDHVEAAILDRVALLFPQVFSSLDEYSRRHRAYLDQTLAAFDREVQFYIACLEYTLPFKRAGLAFCRPAVTATTKEVYGRDVFDLALANRLIRENTPVVTNDFYLREPERIFVVSGPNQGGKTTFARTFGQLHYLASIGCPVPGTDARLFLFDKLFTHFEREEDIRNLSGKLENDLLRIHEILERATPSSILIMNESFLSTTLNDALLLSKQVMEQVIQLDMLCVSVTFLDELASMSETTVSMVSTVNPADPALRTFKIVRRPADGLAYAAAIAEKYRLTYDNVKGRVRKNGKGSIAP